MKRKTQPAAAPAFATDPLWYKDAIIYELRVRSFYDSNGDGIGDFPGLTRKLDYLQRLGVTALWLLPFYPSPLRDDGYDISDYMNVHPDCGTLHDFRTFLREAHRRGLYVITEVVLNHTSDQHPWFQRARRAAPGSPERNFYVWSDTPDRYREARIIFQDFEPSNWSWDPVAKAYYWHRFYAHQPDLNFQNAAVREAVMQVVDFWLGLGVDGLRLDAVPYLYEREGTNCENLPETHEFLRELRRHVDDNFPNRMLLAEANQWPEDAVAYFAEGRECHMAFHFPLMPRMFMAVRMEDRFPITDVWAQTPEIDPSCQWALFLRNHDELTLEMVTDEERDYMYRAYAQEDRMRVNLGIRRRLAPLLGNNRRAIELNNALLFSLPGTPVIYYGDEIGMGDNVFLGDRDGVRTPMQWSPDRNAGFSTANPQRLILPVIIDYEYHYETVNVEAQESNPHSLLWFMRRIIALRRQFKAFGRGSIEFLNPENPRVLAFVRCYENERILAVANLSRFVQYVELDLAKYRGMSPVELFGRNAFPPIGDQPYMLTLGPHLMLSFSIEAPRGNSESALGAYEPATLAMKGPLDAYLTRGPRGALERALAEYLPHCRWFRSKARNLKTVHVSDALRIPGAPDDSCIVMIGAEYTSGEPETYVMPLAVATGDRAGEIRAAGPQRVVAKVRIETRDGVAEGILFDAIGEPGLCRALLDLMERRRQVKGVAGGLQSFSTDRYQELRGPDEPIDARVLRTEQSNSSVVYGDRLILKLFRRLDPGINPDLELGRFLTERAAFSRTPPVAGWIEYRSGRSAPRTLAILRGFVPNRGDAWEFTCHELRDYFERAATSLSEAPPIPAKDLIELLAVPEPDEQGGSTVGAYLEAARLMGHRVAELHLALASEKEDPDFAPEPYSTLYQRSTYQSMRNLQGQVFRQLASRLASMPREAREHAERLLASQARISACLEAILKTRITVTRMRCHGDLHLGQILSTGKDFVIIDFEGEPARSLADRRRKRSALRDVAGMLRSFHYAARTTLLEQHEAGVFAAVDFQKLSRWARLWQTWSSWAFLKEYLATAGQAPFVPRERDELRVLLNAFQMEKAIYELGYELNNRPKWIRIPLSGIEQILGMEEADNG